MMNRQLAHRQGPKSLHGIRGGYRRHHRMHHQESSRLHQEIGLDDLQSSLLGGLKVIVAQILRQLVFQI